MKILFKIIAALLVVIVIAIVAVIATFDPNAYKAEITEVVEQQTGRKLNIDGTISLSFFPWVGVEVGKLSLSNAKGFSKAEFARIEQLDIKAKLLPLLMSKIEIDKIRLHGLFVSLETHKDGKTNWQDMVQADTSAAASASTTNSAETASSSALAGFLVNGLELVNANVQWLDDQAGMQTKISELSLVTGAIQFNEWVPVDFSAKINNKQPQLDMPLALKTKLKINSELTMLDVQNLKLSALGVEVKADLVVTGLDKVPTVKGMVAVSETDLRALAQQFDIALPASAEPGRFSKFSLSALLDANAQRARLDDIQLHLDDTTLSGYVHVTDVVKQVLSYQLKLDRIDVDSYLPAPVETAVVPDAAIAPAEDVVIDLPLELLRKLNLNGELKIASLRVKQVDISDLLIKTSAAKGIIKLDPISMNLLEGSILSSVTLDARATPVYQLKAKATDVKPAKVANPLLVGLLGNQELAIAGVLQMTADITTRGGTLNTLKQSATGPVDITMGHTTVSGVDIVYYLRDSVATYAETKKIPVRENFRGSYMPKEKTAFDKVLVSSKLADGKIHNEQLLMDSKRIKVNGSGVINLLDNTLDEKITVQIDAGSDKTTAEKILQKPVGVRIHGGFAQPVVDVDYASLGKAIAAMLTDDSKAKLLEKSEALKNEAGAKLEAEKLKLKQQEEAKKAELEQQAKDKVKDKLKGLFNR